MKVLIIDGNVWRGKAHYSASLGIVFMSNKVEQHAQNELIDRVTKSSNRTIWR